MYKAALRARVSTYLFIFLSTESSEMSDASLSLNSINSSNKLRLLQLSLPIKFCPKLGMLIIDLLIVTAIAIDRCKSP